VPPYDGSSRRCATETSTAREAAVRHFDHAACAARHGRSAASMRWRAPRCSRRAWQQVLNRLELGNRGPGRRPMFRTLMGRAAADLPHLLPAALVVVAVLAGHRARPASRCPRSTCGPAPSTGPPPTWQNNPFLAGPALDGPRHRSRLRLLAELSGTFFLVTVVARGSVSR
jgi:hypothetical protein